MDYPTKGSLELGMRLVADPTRATGGPIIQMEPNSPETAEEAQRQMETFSNAKFLGFSSAMHQQLHHGPLAMSCETQKLLLNALLAKMFYAGWSAGRQEVMDGLAKQTLGETA